MISFGSGRDPVSQAAQVIAFLYFTAMLLEGDRGVGGCWLRDNHAERLRCTHPEGTPFLGRAEAGHHGTFSRYMSFLPELSPKSLKTQDRAPP